jgi:cysteinyl-tRNA synthetase
MSNKLFLYNTLTQQLEEFQPLNPPFVGMYLCGPTVYGHPHLGHSRGAVTIDVLFRYLQYLDYKVRYVRNITDVGHLLNDADEGEDKIGRIAKLNKIEPMEVVQKYTLSYHKALEQLNTLPPSIEPTASGHIIEQINMVSKIMENGFAYESEGSVYFDVLKYSKSYPYGELSGRKIDELKAGAGEERRTLEGQSQKKNSYDFALWKKAEPEHIMKWPSPWSEGFPGWHIECSAMSEKYLGKQFDIHAGGMDLLFPHHECEIAQSKASNHAAPAKYWLHNNMITINGQKMAKSLNNGILIEQLFTGEHPLLERAYSPMTMRFFILQAHYRSTLDFSNEALQAAEKGYQRLMEVLGKVSSLSSSGNTSLDAEGWKSNILKSLNNDLSTPTAIAHLFEAVKWINEISNGKMHVCESDIQIIKDFFPTVVVEILGLIPEQNQQTEHVDGVMQLVLELRKKAKENKDWATADFLRNELKKLGIEVMDGPQGSSYKISK